MNLLGFKYDFPDILQPEVMPGGISLGIASRVVNIDNKCGVCVSIDWRDRVGTSSSFRWLELAVAHPGYVHLHMPPLPLFFQDAKSHPADGVLVYGMHIEGASWDHATKRLCDPRPDQMRAPAPLVHFLPETDHEPSPGE